jgi:hypothetical protein
MNLLLRMAGWRIPAIIKKRELDKLVHLTSSAFGVEAPPMGGLSYDERLAGYARFTRTAVDRSIARGGNPRDIQDRLFQGAFAYGKRWRKRFGVSNRAEIMKAGRILYRAIGIDFRGTDGGSIEIKQCFFSGYYSPATCGVISSLDAGIMAGLSGGETLSFSRRITEGSEVCRARLGSKETDA